MRRRIGNAASSVSTHRGASRLFAAAISASLLITGLATAEAQANRGDTQRPRALKQSKGGQAAKSAEKPAQPLVLVVSVSRQRLLVYSGEREVANVPISTGTASHPTPTGVFTVVGKERMHYSNLYSAAPMPFMQRITWSGVALHAGVLPGYPASHGCIRLPYAFSRELYGWTSMNTRVIVTRADAAPEEIAHRRLIEPLPSELAVAPISETGAIGSAAAGGEPKPSEVASLVSVAAAAGAATGPEKPRRTKEMAAAARLAEMSRLEAGVQAAEATKAEVVAEAEKAKLAAQEARDAVRKSKVEIDRLREAIARNEKTKRGIESELRSLARSIGPKSSERTLERAAAREDELEETAYSAVLSAETTREELASLQQKHDALVATADSAEAARRTAEKNVSSATNALESAREVLAVAKRIAERSNLPISIFVSRKSGKVYVRQGFQPIHEAPVTIEQPTEPLGTHVFTAIAPTEGKEALRWTVVSIPQAAPEEAPKKSRRGKKSAERQPAVAEAKSSRLPQTASMALNRLVLPDETRDLLAELVKPGSSLVISDNGLSNETGKYTDFIVSTR